MTYLSTSTSISKYAAAFREKAARSFLGHTGGLTKNGVSIVLSNDANNHAKINEFFIIASQNMHKTACEIELTLETGQAVKCGHIDKPRVGKYNNGDLAEGYFAAAVASKLGTTSNVTTTDVLSVLYGLTKPNTRQDLHKTLTVRGVNLSLCLPHDSLVELLTNPDKHLDVMSSAIQFANERVQHEVGTMLVVSDGIGMANKTKADVVVFQDAVRMDAYSVKYKHPQIGQVAGASSEPLWLTFGIQASSYEEAAGKLTPAAVTTGIQHHATRNDVSVQLVTLGDNEYTVQDFSNVHLNEIQIDFQEEKKDTLIIKDTGGTLLRIRKKTENRPNGTYYRNYVEQGDSLKEHTKK